MIKKSITLILILVVIFTGCRQNPQNLIVEDTIETWDVQINQATVAVGLDGTTSALKYNGEIVQLEHEHIPAEGNVFLLLDMVIEKTGVGTDVFSWQYAFILDNDGNKYWRHRNDSFLEQLGYNRIRGADLTLGETRGKVCFEIPVDVANDDLLFIYENEHGIIKISLNVIH